MKLSELVIIAKRGLENVAQMELKKNFPGVKCYMVLCAGAEELDPSSVLSSSDKFVWDESVFEPNQPDTDKLFEAYDRINNLDSRIALADDNSKEKEKLFKEIGTVREQLKQILPKLEFLSFQCELRFNSMEMDEIDRIKKHPVVERIGRTSLSRASIKVVVG